MKVKMLTNRANPKNVHVVGDIVECTDAEAKVLLYNGWAEKVGHQEETVFVDPPKPPQKGKSAKVTEKYKKTGKAVHPQKVLPIVHHDETSAEAVLHVPARQVITVTNPDGTTTVFN